MSITKNKIIALTVCLSLSLLLLAIPLAKADATTESLVVSTDKLSYEEGEIVNIYVQATSIDPGQTITVQDVIVYAPDGTILTELHNLNIEFSDTTTTQLVGSVSATQDGTYNVDASATGCPWTILSHCWFHYKIINCHVTPEFQLVTIGALGAVLGTTGIYVSKKKKNSSH